MYIWWSCNLGKMERFWESDHLRCDSQWETVSILSEDSLAVQSYCSDVVEVGVIEDMNPGGALCEWLQESVQRMHISETEPDSVQQWLVDIRQSTDTECMCVLQGKAIAKTDTDHGMTSPSRSAKESIDAIRGRAHTVSAEFSKLFRKLEKDRWRHVRSSALRITCHIRSLLHECSSSVHSATTNFLQLQQKVIEECSRLAEYVESFTDLNGYAPQKSTLQSLLSTLGHSFGQLVDTALGWLIQSLLETLEQAHSAYSIRTTLNSLTTLGLEGEHLCYLIAKEGGMRVLFDICKQENLQFAHAPALRAIATICCLPESIAELEKVGGIECLSDILGDGTASEVTRSEAAGVVAQVTSPCLGHYQLVSGFLENMEDLIRSLTVLCVCATSHEVFLLGAAALANITFMDNMACDYLLQYNTARVLIDACQYEKAQSLFAKDQVATVLANMATGENCCNEIIESHGIELLLDFLRERPSCHENEAELAACERVQQKAGIALTRIGKDPENAQIIVSLKGIPLLVHLCRNPESRNNSDAVLVASLAALRKISSMCGKQKLNLSDAQQLVEPPLMDSYLMCSTMEESFV